MNKIYENLDINDLGGEVWKDILDYEDDYQVSNIGRVKSFKYDKINGKIKKQRKCGKYFYIDLYKNGISKTKLVHRLIHESFIEKLKKGYDSHHINKEPKDNFVENLKSEPHKKHIGDHHKGTYHSEETKKRISESHKGKIFSEEHRKKISEKKKGENHPNFGKGISNQKIIDIQSDIEKGDLTQREMAKKHEVCQTTISKIKNGKII
jgi:hypothetical protein